MAELNDILQRFNDETLLSAYAARIISGEISVNRNNIEKRIPSIKDNLQDYFDNPNLDKPEPNRGILYI